MHQGVNSLILFLAWLFCVAACLRDPVEQAAKQRACPFWGCAGDNICLTNTQTCVKPCEKDMDCPEDFACKGFFRDITTISGRGKRFCRKAVHAAGESCDPFENACRRELVCVDDTCRQPCETDGECPPEERCLLRVLSAENLSHDASFLVCVPGVLPVGAPCPVSQEPACVRGATCLQEICRKECKSDADCPEGSSCLGRGFSGWRGRLRANSGGEPDFSYCLAESE